jgi:hypothetical protein
MRFLIDAQLPPSRAVMLRDFGLEAAAFLTSCHLMPGTPLSGCLPYIPVMFL